MIALDQGWMGNGENCMNLLSFEEKIHKICWLIYTGGGDEEDVMVSTMMPSFPVGSWGKGLEKDYN